MEVKQVYELVNSATSQITGASGIVQEDLTGVVDLGTALYNANAVDNYVKKLVDRIGKVVFVNRPYRGGVPSVLMDGWEYGSVLQKISADLPDATENQSWELVDGKSYDPNVFKAPKVSNKFFNSKVTFDISPVSITDKQIKESFTSPEAMNQFVSMIYNEVDKSMTVKLDSLIMSTIDNFIGETLHSDYSSGEYSTASSGVKAINLLKLYNEAMGTTLTADKCLHDMEFLKFASYTIGVYVDRISKMSTLFNIGGQKRFTPRDLLHLVLLSDYAEASKVYLQSPTFHDDLVKLPEYETVPYWQGSGTGYGFSDISKIQVKTSGGNEITATGILGVMFDHDALGVCCQDRRVTTNYVAPAEFFNNYYKWDAEYFNDQNENFIVFFVA